MSKMFPEPIYRFDIQLHSASDFQDFLRVTRSSHYFPASIKGAQARITQIAGAGGKGFDIIHPHVILLSLSKSCNVLTMDGLLNSLDS
jgi:hypothetical protein